MDWTLVAVIFGAIGAVLAVVAAVVRAAHWKKLFSEAAEFCEVVKKAAKDGEVNYSEYIDIAKEFADVWAAFRKVI